MSRAFSCIISVRRSVNALHPALLVDVWNGSFFRLGRLHNGVHQTLHVPLSSPFCVYPSTGIIVGSVAEENAAGDLGSNADVLSTAILGVTRDPKCE
jgi:hypothetical protein